jgi:DivIVA domain-containing protein
VVTVLSIVGVLVVLFVASVVATRDDSVLAAAPPDEADLVLPAGPLSPEDVRRVRFGVTVRGYRMREVDEVLDRLANELAERDRRLAALQSPAGETAPPSPS